MVDVSAVIPTKDRASMLCRAIDSVLAQTVEVREIIVVDDGSSDDTMERLVSYDERVQVLRQGGKGASCARNFGVRESTGEWIAFLDDDDIWFPEKIERQIEVAMRDRDIALVYCSDYGVDDELNTLFVRTANPKNQGDIFEQLLLGNFMPTPTILARKSAIVEAGYMNESIVFGEDWDLWLRIAARHKVGLVSTPLVGARQNPVGSISRDMPVLDRLKDMQKVVDGALKLRPVASAVRRNVRRRMACRWAQGWLSAGHRRSAFASAMKAMTYGPTLEALRIAAAAILRGNASSTREGLQPANRPARFIN